MFFFLYFFVFAIINWDNAIGKTQQCDKSETCHSHGHGNATFKQCPNPCPRTCEFPGGTGPCSKMCLKEGYECNEGFYLTEKGKCVELQDCPGAKTCKRNEIFVFCKAGCPTNFCPVDDSRAIVACSPPFPCRSGCACKADHVRVSRKDDRCILASRCPPVKCTRPNEEWNGCPPPCFNERCADIGKPILCDKRFSSCRPQCVCKPGFYRNDTDICVPEKKCPNLVCGGDRNAIFKECPNPCPRTCEFPGGTGLCKRMCIKEGCECKEGYYLNDKRKCVKFEDCPGAKTCRANEIFVFCKAGCPNDYCPVDDSRAIVACSPPFPCRSGCACTANHLRLSSEDDRCILASKCPPVECTRRNEVWNPCPPPCFSDRCSDIGNPSQCDKRFFSCRPQCVCKPGFYRNNEDICVHEKKCPPKCGFNEMPVKCKTICPPQSCENSYTEYACGPKTCEPGCDCLPNYLRNASGICIPNDECPYPPFECGFNEIPSSCRIICPPQTCDSIFTSYLCENNTVCEPGCNCLDGYLRNDSDVCVPSKECFPQPECSLPTCANPNPQNCALVDPATDNKDKIQCEPGYILSDINGECIRIEECPGDIGCNGDPNAIATACPWPCQSTCDSPNAGTCGQKCIPVGCQCKPGYILSEKNGICILPKECKFGNPCGANGTFSECAFRCPNQYCPEDDSQLQIACKPGRPCPSGCLCKDYYRRKSEYDDTCVLACDCPAVECTRDNEIWNPCASECLAEKCTDINQNQDCVPDPKNCQPKCVCHKGYYRNQTGSCVPKKECKPTCSVKPECRPTCAVPNPPGCNFIQPSEINDDDCNCQAGYVLSQRGGKCIKIEECPTDIGCNNDPNARVKECPLPCPSTCNSPNATPCKRMCDPIGCECKPGYILSKEFGKCILPDDCKGGNPCGPNGTFVYCRFNCPTNYCPTDESRAVVVCETFPFAPCYSGCACRLNHRLLSRENPICIQSSECPELPCTSRPYEKWSRCPMECRSEYCEAVDQPPVTCNTLVLNCNPQCVCKNSYFRDPETDICVSSKECRRINKKPKKQGV